MPHTAEGAFRGSGKSWRSTLKVVLVSPRNPLNIGAAARAMSNFGFSELRLVNPYKVAFREARSAVGAAPVMAAAKEFSCVADAVADCTLVAGTTTGAHREMPQELIPLDAGVKRLRNHKGEVALLFGSEKFGLSNDDMSHCHWLMSIPSRGEHRSMNLGQAVAICLYEMTRTARKLVPVISPKHASSEQVEVLHQRLDDILGRSGYYDHTGVLGSERRLRALLKRMNLSARDAAVWLGIYRQILWKLKQN
ncbi:MAG: RNA methyltransferase [Candidatus Solibacter usitatus]|nr:RNA methyltransferase [Candidatus Solibacter usitatus]